MAESKKKILIIDDDLDILETMQSLLEFEGFQILSADSVEKGMEVIAQAKPDLILLDVMFPENPAGGFDLARAIRKTAGIQGLPVILLTAINQELPMEFSSADIDKQWMPVQDFVEKPVALSVLLEKVGGLLKGRR